MSRFKIKFKIQGLELDIEGDRRDVGLISRAVGDQVAGLIAPTNEIVDGIPSMKDITPPIATERKTRRKKPGTNSGNGATAVSTTAIDFKHEPERFGTPTQDWTTAQKAMWLIHVVAELTDRKQITTGLIFETFNKHFKQAGALNRSNAARDLGKAKARVGDSPALVGEDTTKTPGEWYLLAEGTKSVQALINKALGTNSAT